MIMARITVWSRIDFRSLRLGSSIAWDCIKNPRVMSSIQCKQLVKICFSCSNGHFNCNLTRSE